MAFQEEQEGHPLVAQEAYLVVQVGHPLVVQEAFQAELVALHPSLGERVAYLAGQAAYPEALVAYPEVRAAFQVVQVAFQAAVVAFRGFLHSSKFLRQSIDSTPTIEA